MKIIFPLIFASIFINQSHAAIQMELPRLFNIEPCAGTGSVRDDVIISFVGSKLDSSNPDTIIDSKNDFFISDNLAIGGQDGLRYPIVLTTTGQSGYDRGAGSMLSRANVIIIKS